VGATHADPHPGNFRLLDDNRLAVLDFGSVADDTGLFTHLFAQTLILTTRGDYDAVLEAWREAGLVSDSTTTEQLMEMLDPDDRPYTREEFTFSKEWLQSRSQQFQDPVQALQGASRLRFPPSYLLEHRAVMGTIALLCGLDATVDFRNVIDGVGDAVAQPA
jgi:predicted unusual protein kinase regulating ubiquinone biosynthesis (AarF/ABC1/UbiB family)